MASDAQHAAKRARSDDGRESPSGSKCLRSSHRSRAPTGEALKVNPDTPHIIVGFAEALAAPEVVWSLRDSGFEVTVANRRERRTALHHSRAASILDVTPPEQDLAACVGELIGAAEARGAMLMPVDDACVAVCAQIAEQRSAPIVIGPRGRQAGLALDKRKQIDVAQHSGLLVPPTEVVQTISELRNAAAEFAVVLKDANAMRIDDGRLARGRSFVCANPDELAVAEAAWGEGYTLSCSRCWPASAKDCSGCVSRETRSR